MSEVPWPRDAPLFGSGRDALVALVRWGAERAGWRRVVLPSYYCPEVPEALRAQASPAVEVLAWPDHDLAVPLSAGVVRRLGLAPGDVLVVANQLGLRTCPEPASLKEAVATSGAVLVDDHSHDPASVWADRSHADYAFASLRKTLPLPDGGLLWSPRCLALPPDPGRPEGAAPRRGSGTRSAAVATPGPIARSAGASPGRASGTDPLDAALRRRDARAPSATGSPPFRALARSGADVAVPGAGSPISPTSRSLLPTMPVVAWRARRARNLAILAAAVGQLRGARLLASPPGGIAFALTVAFDDAADREQAREALAGRAVAPTVIWPLDTSMPGVGPDDADLSRRLLSIHCDQRYGDDDMRRLGRVLGEVLGRPERGPGRSGLPRPTGAG